jgi:hypothetical protein
MRFHIYIPLPLLVIADNWAGLAIVWILCLEGR